MKRFSYTARTDEGEIKKGFYNAKRKEDLIESLRKERMVAISIKEISENPLKKIQEIGLVSSTEKVMFSKELSTMVNAGIPIAQALHILEEQSTNKKLKSAVIQIAEDVEGGAALSFAIEKHPAIFSSLYVNMVKAGEVSGTLDETLERMADEIEKEHELMASIRGAMAYPTVILLALVVVVAYLLTSVIPKISEIFLSLGGNLPATTKFLLSLSDLARNHGIIIIILLVTAVMGVRFVIKKNQGVRLFWHSILNKVPIFGKLAKKINVTRFTRTLGSLLASGVSVLEAIDVAENILKNEVFKKEIQEAAKKIKDGSSLSEPFKSSKVFPIMVSQMIAVGEDTGTLDKILLKLTSFYQKEVDHTIKNLSSLLEPIMMIVIGIGAGFIVISIITPIYSMTNLF